MYFLGLVLVEKARFAIRSNWQGRIDKDTIGTKLKELVFNIHIRGWQGQIDKDTKGTTHKAKVFNIHNRDWHLARPN